jgi:hypothetical protein
VAGHKGGTTTWNFEPDTDGDTVPDIADLYPHSDLHPTVDVGTGPTNVTNRVDKKGASIQDLVNKIATTTYTGPKYLKAITSLTKDLQKAGTVTKAESEALKAAAGQFVNAVSQVSGATLSLNEYHRTGPSPLGDTPILPAAGAFNDSTPVYTGPVVAPPNTATGGDNDDFIKMQMQGVPFNMDTSWGHAVTPPAGGTPLVRNVGFPSGGLYSGDLVETKGFTVSHGTLTVNTSQMLTGSVTLSGDIHLGPGSALLIQGPATVKLTGHIFNDGTVRVDPGATLDASGAASFLNNGTVITFPGTVILPANLTNGPYGRVLTRDPVGIKTFTRTGITATLTVDSLTGHTYQLQRSPNLSEGFTNAGASQAGATGTVLTFTSDDTGPQGFYRIAVDP